MKKKLLSILLAICMLCTLLPMSVLAATPAENEIKLELVKDSTTFPGKDVLRVDFYAKSGTDVPDNHMVYLKYDAKKLAPLSAETADDVSEYCTNFSENNSSALTANPYTIKAGMGKKTSEVMLYTIIKEGKGYICWKVTEPTGTPAFADFTRISSIFFGLKGGVNFDKLPKDIIKLATVADDYTVTAQSNSISITVNGGEALRYGNKTASNNNLTVDLDNLFVAGDGVKFASSTPATLTGISVKTAPTKVIYTEGESFDKTGMVIEATYSDSTKKDVTTYTYTPTAALTTSDTTITISYTEDGVTKTCTQAITVNAAPATKTLSSISVKTAPTKVIYTEGESFDKTGMVIEATYSDSTKKDVTTYTYTPTGALTTSDSTITISYTEGSVTKTCTQTITVNAVTPPAPATLTGISVKTAPTKVTYNEGESFDKTGMVIEATYNDGSKKDVTTYTYTPTGALTTADTTITISYTEGSETKTCTQAITVNAAPPAPVTLTGISVKTAPSKVTYTEGENFDKTGMVIEATYSDSTKKDVTGYTYAPTAALTTSDTTITISYTEDGVTKTCTQTITVNAVTPPAPTEYTITFNVNGGSGTIPPQTTSGQKLSSLPTATRSGSYSFDGWYTSGGTQITTAYVFSANTTVYAHWTYTGGSSSGVVSAPTYPITVDKSVNGSVSVSNGSAVKDASVTITVKPDKGYTLETLTVLDKNGYALELTEKNGRFTFKMPASAVIVKATFMDDNTMLNLFVDVKASDYFYDAVLWAAEKGVTSGTDALHFSPNAPCTRAQIVTFLWRAAGSPAPKNMSSFADVPADAFYAKAVAWAVENGITGGTGDGKFSPDAPCTRAQAVTFLYRASGAPAVSGNAAFSDVATNAYYAAAVKWAEKNGITGGIGGGLFGSNNNCTRAQIVAFLYRSVK